MRKILVTGGSGHFASSMKKFFSSENFELIYLNKEKLDVKNKTQVEKVFREILPDIVIHTAAITRPMIKHEINPVESILTNIIGTANIAVECQKNNIKMIYLSTDHVYEGKTGDYKEESPVLPVNKYAWSKLGGECSVMLLKNYCILRIAAVQHPFPHKKALVDSYKSSIYITDIVKIIHKFIDKRGVYNIGGEKKSIYEFVKHSKPDIDKISINEITGIEMPKDVSLNLNKMKEALEND